MNPSMMNWNIHFPSRKADQLVEFVDVGCGYGGLLVALAKQFPNTLMLGMEIRIKVTDYVSQRIAVLRNQQVGCFGNISVLRANAMKFLPNFYQKSQVSNYKACWQSVYHTALSLAD